MASQYTPFLVKALRQQSVTQRMTDYACIFYTPLAKASAEAETCTASSFRPTVTRKPDPSFHAFEESLRVGLSRISLLFSIHGLATENPPMGLATVRGLVLRVEGWGLAFRGLGVFRAISYKHACFTS